MPGKNNENKYDIVDRSHAFIVFKVIKYLFAISIYFHLFILLFYNFVVLSLLFV